MSTAEPHVRLARHELGGTRLLLSDIRVGYVLVDEAIHRVETRLFGIPRDKSFLFTTIALATLAQVIHDRVSAALRIETRPTLADPIIAAATLKESIHGLAGAASRDTPPLRHLVLIAVVGTSFRPVLGASARGVRAVSHGIHASFDHRYGHILRPHRRRSVA